MKNNKQSIFNIDSFYVIGDIHGQSLKLLEVIKEIEDVDKNPFLIFVGDILGFDGDNLKTLEVISDLKKKYKGKVYVIEGNHDNFFKLDITEGFQRGYIKKIKNLHPLDLTTMSPSDLIRFLNEKKVFHVFEEMIPYFETKNALITHAPIPFNSWNFFSKGFKFSNI